MLILSAAYRIFDPLPDPGVGRCRLRSAIFSLVAISLRGCLSALDWAISRCCGRR